MEVGQTGEVVETCILMKAGLIPMLQCGECAQHDDSIRNFLHDCPPARLVFGGTDRSLGGSIGQK